MLECALEFNDGARAGNALLVEEEEEVEEVEEVEEEVEEEEEEEGWLILHPTITPYQTTKRNE